MQATGAEIQQFMKEGLPDRARHMEWDTDEFGIDFNIDPSRTYDLTKAGILHPDTRFRLDNPPTFLGEFDDWKVNGPTRTFTVTVPRGKAHFFHATCQSYRWQVEGPPV